MIHSPCVLDPSLVWYGLTLCTCMWVKQMRTMDYFIPCRNCGPTPLWLSYMYACITSLFSWLLWIEYTTTQCSLMVFVRIILLLKHLFWDPDKTKHNTSNRKKQKQQMSSLTFLSFLFSFSLIPFVYELINSKNPAEIMKWKLVASYSRCWV